ncbi:Leucine-rich repeat-containing protein 23 [Taenia solium]|eukprot:TsM_000188600 transcript=TsM_000188600 gene=TsM_000188600
MSQEEEEVVGEEPKQTNVGIKPTFTPDKPLTKELAATCLSQLKRIGYGFSHAFIKFSCVNRGITDITLLVKFQFLRFVILSHNHISDISPIFAAEYLTYLKADHNRIVKAGNEKSLQYLQFYDLSHNKLTCTDYINHGRLKHLILSYNEITTLKGVEGPPLNQFKLRSLETLELRGNKITSSEGLSELHDLKTLYFSENLLRSVGDISPMKELSRLHLRDNNIRRLDGFLQGPPNLLYLNLRWLGGCLHGSGAGQPASTIWPPKSLKPAVLTNEVLHSLSLLSSAAPDAPLSQPSQRNQCYNPIADRDHYRPVVLGILPRLQRLDKDKTSPTEIADAVAFYEKLDVHFMEEDEEEAEEEGKAAELMAEAKLDELIEEGGMGKAAAEVVVEEGGNEEMDNEPLSFDRRPRCTARSASRVSHHNAINAARSAHELTVPVIEVRAHVFLQCHQFLLALGEAKTFDAWGNRTS